MIINGSSPILSLSTYSCLNTLFNALLALKIGKEDTKGSRYIRGAEKNVMMAQCGITKDNYVMVGFEA